MFAKVKNSTPSSFVSSDIFLFDFKILCKIAPQKESPAPVQPDGVHNSAPNSVLLLNQENS